MSIQRLFCRFVGLAAVLACVSAAPAAAFEAHNFLEPSFGSLTEAGPTVVDPTNGNVLAVEGSSNVVDIYGPEGGGPAGGVQPSLIGAGTPEGAFGYSLGLAVNGAGKVAIGSGGNQKVYEYGLGSSGEYEYLCEIAYYAPTERCLSNGGEASESTVESSRILGNDAYDADGDLYVLGTIVSEGHEQSVIFEFGPASEGLRVLDAPVGYAPVEIAIAAGGTIYVRAYSNATQRTAVLALKRASTTGPVQGEKVVAGTEGATGTAVDRATGQLFVDLGSYGEALNASEEVVSRFGSEVITQGQAIAVNEGSGEVYVANLIAHVIDRFGPGVNAFTPTVDSPPPTVTDLTRTSAELSGIVDTGNATTTYQLQYVVAGEYQPAASNPYAGGGSTAPVKLAAGAAGEGVGPLVLTGLSAGTTYHYRLVATNEVGTTYGQDHTFTTAAATPPLVSTGAASEVTQTGVLLSGSVDADELQTSYEFEVGTDTSYGGAKLFGNAGASGTEAVSAGLQYLIPGTTYHYRLLATNEDGTTYGQDMTFTTPGYPSSIAAPASSPLLAVSAIAFPKDEPVMTRATTKTLTTKQKLQKALKVCQRDKNKHKRAGCEKQAQQKYGAVKKRKKA